MKNQTKSKFTLVPDFIFPKFTDITPEFLKSNGIKALLIDIDNTLAPYEEADAGEHIIAWFAELKKHNVKAALVSNNDNDRVIRFNEKLGLVAFADCKKPSRKVLTVALQKLGADKSHTAILGDQIFTDVLSGRRLGLHKAIIVPPIKDKTSLFFKTKRLLEVPFIKKYNKLNKK